LKKLDDARRIVDELSKKAGEQKILLNQKKQEANIALIEI